MVQKETSNTTKLIPHNLVVQGDYGQCYIMDCMDPQYGLPTFEDQSIDLIWTDPPWGFETDNQQNPMGLNKKAQKDYVVTYDDTMNFTFTRHWMDEILRIGKSAVVCCGSRYINWYMHEFPPLGIFIVTFNNGQCMTKIAKFSGHAAYLCYGDRFLHHKFHRTAYHTFTPNGFLRDLNGLVHPYPKSGKDWRILIGQIAPESVLDPFMGSGATAEACESLSCVKRWIGYEIEPLYANDIQIRIERGRHHRKQKNITQFMGGDKDGTKT